MTQIRLVEPPEPPEGEQWCPVCLMLARWQQISRHASGLDGVDLDALAADGDDRAVHWVPWPQGVRLLAARYRGMSAIMPELLLCWECIGFIDAGARPPAANGGQRVPGYRSLPPGLRGKGGR